MKVLVVSDDGWMGAIAWRQLGVKWVYCLPLTLKSREQLEPVARNLAGVTIVTPPMGVNMQCDIVLAHLTKHLTLPEAKGQAAGEDTTRALMNQFTEIPHKVVIVRRCHIGRTRKGLPELFGTGTREWHCKEVRHHQLGGLTNCRAAIFWLGSGPCSSWPTVNQRNKSQAQTRSRTAFLDVVTRAEQWKNPKPELGDRIWRPFGLDQGRMFPWPYDSPTKSVWVEAPSNHHRKDELVVRELTVKEKANLLDLRPDLHSTLVEEAWCWEEYAATPTRFVTEFGLQFAPAFAETHEAVLGEPWDLAGNGSLQRAPLPRELELPSLTDSNLERLDYFGWVWDPSDSLNVSVAVKADSAKVDAELWNVGGTSEGHRQARDAIRGFLHRVWCRKLTKEVIGWLKSGTKGPEDENLEAARECVTRACNSTWWDWADGSRLFFWRWPTLWLREARDGARANHLARPIRRLHFPDVPVMEEWIIKLDREKILKLLDRRYLEDSEGTCWTTIPRFPVPKGKIDIRVVWDLTRNGVNATIYTPAFFLPTIATLARRIQNGDYQGDFDVGEQFHNFMLHKSERQFCGVWIPDELVDEANGRPKLMRWCRAPFGWTCSPYLTLRMLARAVEIAKGDLDDESNPFGWTHAVENYPGSEDYDPSQPRIRLVKRDGLAAAMCLTFYDDGRVFGPTEGVVVRGTRKICAGIQNKGIQDAARKRRKPSQRAGAWCGGVIHSDLGLPRKFVSHEKWLKTKGIVAWLEDHIRSGEAFQREEFLQKRGFLVHISMTYDHFKPYLKGMHLAVEAWRPGRDADGWPIDGEIETGYETSEEWDGEEGFMQSSEELGLTGRDSSKAKSQTVEPPPIIEVTNQLKEDTKALKLFTQTPNPVMVLLRPVKGMGPLCLAYGFGDASGEGYGSYIAPAGGGVTMRHGFWCDEISEKSSNYRELRNLVELVQEEVKLENLRGREVWIFTDNLVAEYVLYKGASKSQELTSLITNMRMLAISGQFTLQLVHIAGTRMILQGTDALSRGEVHLSLLTSKAGNTVPLHQTAISRNPRIMTWLKEWIPETFRVARATDWFRGAQQMDDVTDAAQPHCWIWDLPPAGALDALEELGGARLKRHDLLLGVVLIPQLMRSEWYRRLTRVVDLYFVIPAGVWEDVWPAKMHEGLTVGLFFPLLRHRPWDWKNVGFMGALGGALSRLHRAGDPRGRDLLREFWCARTWIAGMPSHLRTGTNFSVWQGDAPDTKMSESETDYFLKARPGDHLVCPFECDECLFFRVKGRVSIDTDPSDRRLLDFIRRANLDAFWSRAPDTVKGLHRQFREQGRVGEMFGFEMFHRSVGPFGREYDNGIRAAIGVLWKSQQPGRHEATIKYSTARKVRSLHTNLYMATPLGGATAPAMRNDRSRQTLSKLPTDSEWFTRVMAGFRARVGERRRQDAAISIDLMLEIQRRFELRWEDQKKREREGLTGNEGSLRQIAEHAAFHVLTYCGSMRGFETVKIVLDDLRNQIFSPAEALSQLSSVPPHVSLPLLGRFKARSQEVQRRLIDIAWETHSGLFPGRWATRLVEQLELDNITTGWAFQDDTGAQRRMNYFSEGFYDLLGEIQEERTDLIAQDIDVPTDFGLARSARRGATTRATVAKVDPDLIDWINRWNIGEDDVVHGPMRVVYSDRRQLLTKFLPFSAAL